MANPTWFIEQDYLASKLAKLKAADPETYGSWTTDEVKKAIEEAGLTPYDHFVAFNKEEGTSPNQYFNAYEYIEAKVRQLNADKVDDRDDWNFEQVKEALDSVGGAWAHYQAFGAAEGLNPSNSFSVKGYYAAKAAELGGDWTAEKVEEYFKENNVNPLDHYFELGKEEGVEVVAVPADERVNPDPTNVGSTFELTTGRDYVGPTDPETPADFANVIKTTSGNDTIEGVVSALSSENTLNVTDVIDGGEGTLDTLKLDLKGNFAGFTKGQGSLSNVERVELTNTGAIQRTFAAREVSGVNEYVINGATAGVDLTDLASIPASVSISGQKSGTSAISFAADVTKGTSDAIALKLNNVGTASGKNADGSAIAEASVTVTANGIETVSVDAAGTVVAALAGTDAKALNISGDGSLKLTAIQAGIKTINAAAASGAADINLANATAITSYAGSAGDDTIRAEAGSFAANAKIEGGAGKDVLKTKASGTVQYEMSGVETVELANAASLTFSGAKTSGLERIVVSKDASAAAQFASLGSGDLVVDLEQTQNTADLQIDNAGTVTANVKVTSAASASAIQASAGDLTALKASAVTVNVAKFGELTGKVQADAATQLAFNVDGAINNTVAAAKATAATVTATNADTTSAVTFTTGELRNLSVTSAGAFAVNGGSTLDKLETLTVDAGKGFTATGVNLDTIHTISLSGSGASSAVTLANLGGASLGYGVTLNASGLKGGLTTGSINTGAGNAITVNADSVAGNVSLASGAGIAVAQAGGKNTGSVTINAANVVGDLTVGAITAQTINVDASSVLGSVTVGALAGDTITFNALNALGTVAATNATVGKSLTYTGAELKSNIATIDVAGTDISLFLKGGLENDTFTVTGFEATTAAQKVTITGDLGLGTDVVNINLAGQGSAGAIELNLKGLSNAGVTVTGVQATQGAANFTYYGVNGSDTINLKSLKIADQTGQVKIDLYANDGSKDEVIFGSELAITTGTAAVKAFEVTGFEAGINGTDVLSFTSGLLTQSGGTAVGTGTAAFTEVAKGSINATELNGVTHGIFEISGTSDVAAGQGTNKDVVFGAIFGTATVDGLGTDVSKLFVLDDGTDSYLWIFKPTLGGAAGNTTAAADDLQLIGVVKGVTDFAQGDFNIVAA